MELYFITHNPSKYDEASYLANTYSLKLRWKNIEYEELQEDDLEIIAKRSCERIIENYPELSSFDFFLEDAGLFIESLDGFPGPYSAYVFKKLGNRGSGWFPDPLKNKEGEKESCIII